MGTPKIKPNYTYISARICELCEAVKEASPTDDHYADYVQLWTYEINELAALVTNILRRNEEQTYGMTE